MTELDFKTYNNIVFCGDIHGLTNLKTISLNYIKDINNSLIIFCGDIGIGFSSSIIEKNILKDCNEIIKQQNIHYILFRGNHDNPLFFTNNSEYNQSNITLIQDYTILNTQNNNILCIGGGISIDRVQRIPNISYWDNETVIPLNEELKYKIKNLSYNIDIICTHNAPTYIKPVNIDINTQGQFIENWSLYDNELKKDVWNDRTTLNEIEDFIKQYHHINYWIYGHFHDHFYSEYDNIKFIGLDMFYLYAKTIKYTLTKSLIKRGPDFLDINDIEKYNNVIEQKREID